MLAIKLSNDDPRLVEESDNNPNPIPTYSILIPETKGGGLQGTISVSSGGFTMHALYLIRLTDDVLIA